jgi:hypothetical protein
MLLDTESVRDSYKLYTEAERRGVVEDPSGVES